jgi:hypothetical protein
VSDEVRPRQIEHATAPDIEHHFCEREGCGKVAGWGFAKPKQTPHWFCFAHKDAGERYL